MQPQRYFTKKEVVKRVLMFLTTISLITTLSAVTFYSAASTNRVIPSENCDGGDCCQSSDCSCPNCAGNGESAGEPAGDCTLCGGARLCGTCNGCLDCGYNRFDDCPECSGLLLPEENSRGDVTVEDDPVPLFFVNDRGFFLFAPMGIPTWSVFNLILTAAGIFLSIITILRALYQKREEFTEVDKCAAKIMSGDSANKDELLIFIANEDNYNKRRRLIAFAVKYVLSFAAVLLLLLTQNFKGAIAIFDFWSAVHLIMFTGIIISGFLVFKKIERSYLNYA